MTPLFPALKETLVVLDAGHGGHDPGALSYSKLLKESNVALAVCREADLFLRALGFSTHLTRETDKFLPLKTRAVIANSLKAQLFVSVHCNSFNKRVSGIETFHFPGSRRGKSVATSVQEQLMARFPNSNNRGVKTARFAVLRHTRMAGILAELEFIDVEKMERRFQNHLAIVQYGKALAEGVAHAQLVSGKDGSYYFNRALSVIETLYQNRTH